MTLDRTFICNSEGIMPRFLAIHGKKAGVSILPKKLKNTKNKM